MMSSVVSRRKLVTLLSAFPAVGLFGSAAVADNPSKSSTVWHRLSDRERGLRIVSAALYWNGKRGGQCKVWVQNVIGNVTGGHVSVPANASDITHKWKSDKSGHIKSLGASISRARAGDIVQMVIRDRSGNPIGHTAIVGSTSGGAITWLESNYRGDGAVTSSRVQSQQDFFSSLHSGQYTVYRIK